MDTIKQALTKMDPTEEQRIEIIKLVMNHKQPIRPEGERDPTSGIITWEHAGMRIKLSSARNATPTSSYTVTVTDATDNNKILFVFWRNQNNTEITQYYRQSNEEVSVEYSILQEILSTTIFTDKISERGPGMTINIRINADRTMQTGGKVALSSFLNQKYEELKPSLMTQPPTYPKTLSDITTPEITARVNEWLAYLITTSQ
jgi:hypothetical protein